MLSMDDRSRETSSSLSAHGGKTLAISPVRLDRQNWRRARLFLPILTEQRSWISINPEGLLRAIGRRVGDRTYKGESPVLRGPSTVQRCRLPGRCVVVPGPSTTFWYSWYLSSDVPVSRKKPLEIAAPIRATRCDNCDERRKWRISVVCCDRNDSQNNSVPPVPPLEITPRRRWGAHRE